MAEWLVEVRGSDRDLRLFQQAHPETDWKVAFEDGRCVLRSTQFAGLTDEQDVRRLASEYVDHADLACRMESPEFDGLKIGAVIRRNDDGTAVHHVYARDTLHVFASMDAVIVTNNGRTLRPTPPDITQTIRLIPSHPELRAALRYLRDEPTWPGLYKAFEAIQKAVGGTTLIAARGWASKNKCDRFTGSAQPDRHHDWPGPKKPMTLDEGHAFVVSLLKKWLASLATSGSGSP